MKIKGIGKKLELYKFDKKLSFEELQKILGLSKRTLQLIIESDSVPKTESFIKLFHLLDLDLEEFINNQVMTQINNVLAPNHGTIQNIVAAESRHELELIIEHLKKENLRLEDSLRRADEMIELLKKRK